MDEIIHAYLDPDIAETYIVACHGVSKTMTCALLAEYHVSVMGHPVFTTAPTHRQVNDLLWNQIRINRVQAESKLTLPGKILETAKIKLGKDRRWQAKGFSPKDPDSAQGEHLDNLLVLVDEAAGIPDWMWAAIKGWTTNPGCQIIGIGNPNRHLSYFREQFFSQLGRKKTHAIRINAHDSPNVTTWENGKKKTKDEQEVLKRPIPALASDEWLEARASEWGIQSPTYQMKALGKWPEVTDDERAIPMDWIWEGFKRTDEAIRNGELVDPDSADIIKIAQDMARKGVDKCCRGSLRAPRYVKVDTYSDETDTMKTIKSLHLAVANCDPKPIFAAIDGNAVGGSAVDRANEYRDDNPDLWGDCFVNEIDWGSNPNPDAESKRKKKKKSNKIQHTTIYVAYLYYRLRRALDPERPVEELLYLPTEKSLRKVGLSRNQFAAQLNARKCWWDEYNRFHVEPKHELKRRAAKEMQGATSCDVADMVAMLMDDGRRKKRKLRFARRGRRK